MHSAASSRKIYSSLILASAVLAVVSLFTIFRSATNRYHADIRYIYTVPLTFDAVLGIFIGLPIAISVASKIIRETCLPEVLLFEYVFCLQLLKTPSPRKTLTPLRQTLHEHIIELVSSAAVLSLAMNVLPLVIFSQNVLLNIFILVKVLPPMACVAIIIVTLQNVVVEMSSSDPWLSTKPDGIIPQEPILFSGTIRENLDPFGELDDSEPNSVFRACGCLEETVSENDLAHKIFEMTGRIEANESPPGLNNSSPSSPRIYLSTPVVPVDRVSQLGHARFFAWHGHFVEEVKLSSWTKQLHPWTTAQIFASKMFFE